MWRVYEWCFRSKCCGCKELRCLKMCNFCVSCFLFAATFCKTSGVCERLLWNFCCKFCRIASHFRHCLSYSFTSDVFVTHFQTLQGMYYNMWYTENMCPFMPVERSTKSVFWILFMKQQKINLQLHKIHYIFMKCIYNLLVMQIMICNFYWQVIHEQSLHDIVISFVLIALQCAGRPTALLSRPWSYIWCAVYYILQFLCDLLHWSLFIWVERSCKLLNELSDIWVWLITCITRSSITCFL